MYLFIYLFIYLIKYSFNIFIDYFVLHVFIHVLTFSGPVVATVLSEMGNVVAVCERALQVCAVRTTYLSV